ncbi:uncharacterized protein PV07_09393 [Cladophialophora immunda]|uniref:Uncharacterized protein n=1 Tax=Cladophialophora immunda TaxID=569365 RepID=A0A0D2AMF3_9EURO|nr:uncharacterized protein PV07_09393 [Cladophialophora immunda]KIW26287.1 hypothetical protein PV07_09393 [Cladophialophora immunda]
MANQNPLGPQPDFNLIGDDIKKAQNLPGIRDGQEILAELRALRQEGAATQQAIAAIRQDSAATQQAIAAIQQDGAATRQELAAIRQDMAAMRQDLLTMISVNSSSEYLRGKPNRTSFAIPQPLCSEDSEYLIGYR